VGVKNSKLAKIMKLRKGVARDGALAAYHKKQAKKATAVAAAAATTAITAGSTSTPDPNTINARLHADGVYVVQLVSSTEADELSQVTLSESSTFTHRTVIDHHSCLRATKVVLMLEFLIP
jgi:type II secretory pathway component PulM